MSLRVASCNSTIKPIKGLQSKVPAGTTAKRKLSTFRIRFIGEAKSVTFHQGFLCFSSTPV